MKMMETAEISYAELGKTVCERRNHPCPHQEIGESGIVKGTRLNVDLKQLGYDITGFCRYLPREKFFVHTVAKDLMNIPEIVRLNYITGNYSMFIEIVCKDISQLRKKLHDELQKIKGIESVPKHSFPEEGFNRNVQVVLAE